ncbi:predicted protein [Histoplasma capsulatum var. duboisii H88]|uniref:Predicted protein n=1 Tax=Ajellomyces capsulatus (strain H88) TaxID=544711 RepID=F0UTR0_AJEC8|nr:predicted protein [Histoplasma capsulatum var. duboisii H88]
MPSPNGAGPPPSRTKASDNGILIPDPGCWSPKGVQEELQHGAKRSIHTHHTRCGMCDGRRRCDGGNNVGCTATTITIASTVLTLPSPRSPAVRLSEAQHRWHVAPTAQRQINRSTLQISSVEGCPTGTSVNGMTIYLL